MVNRDFIQYREEYGRHRLIVDEMLDEPIDQFRKWFREAEAAKVIEPNTMTLATVGDQNQPTIRIVLMKEIVPEGLIFYTNFNSRKGKEMAQHPRAALNFFWQSMERQVRFDGMVSKIDEKKSKEYFCSRPRGSQLGAWVSAQSETIPSRDYLEEKLEEYKAKFKDGDIPKPPHWGGYILAPSTVEFWQGGENRLHDRIQYSQDQGGWTKRRLAP